MQKLLQRLVRFWQQKVHRRLASLIATVGIFGLLSCLIIIYIVAQISNEVWEQDAFAFDKTVLLWIHSFANPVLDRLMHLITRLNDPITVSAIAAVAFGLPIWRRYYPEAKIFVLDCIGDVILSYGLKSVFGKVRPALWESAIKETSFSYPSGHALGSTVLYGFLAYLLASHYPH